MAEKLKVWIIRASEALPIDQNGKLMRAGLLAEYLAENGHDVTWWTSTFVHGEKRYRFTEQKEIDVTKHEKLILLHSSKAYKKNVSFSRIKYYKELAKEFRKNCENYEVPDIIICSYPTVEFAKEAERYGERHNVPVIVDVRDFWPDIFIAAIPNKLKIFANIPIYFMKKQAEGVFRKAHGITGMSTQALEWGLKKAHREKRETDKKIFIGVKKEQYSELTLQKELERWTRLGVTKDTFNLCFFSTLGMHLDLYTVIEAVKRIGVDYPEIRLVICGEGDDKKRLEQAAGNASNIIFAGWANDVQMQSLMKISKIGLYTISNRNFLEDTISNKMIQYMSEGLPIITSLRGLSKEYIDKFHMGFSYEEGNVEEIEKIIRTLLIMGEDETYLSMRKNSLERFWADFEYHVVGKQFEECIVTNLKKYEQR